MAPYPASSKANWAGRDRSCSPRYTTRSHNFQPKSWPPGDRAAPRLDTHTHRQPRWRASGRRRRRDPRLDYQIGLPPRPIDVRGWRSWPQHGKLFPSSPSCDRSPFPPHRKGGCPRSGRSNCLRGAPQRPERRQQRKESGARGGISWPCKGSPPASKPASHSVDNGQRRSPHHEPTLVFCMRPNADLSPRNRSRESGMPRSPASWPHPYCLAVCLSVAPGVPRRGPSHRASNGSLSSLFPGWAMIRCSRHREHQRETTPSHPTSPETGM